jgi:hypothetical protein
MDGSIVAHAGAATGAAEHDAIVGADGATKPNDPGPSVGTAAGVFIPGMMLPGGATTALQPGVAGAEAHVIILGRTTEHPAVDGVAMQVASFGNTSEQPSVVGIATHCATVGSE